MATAHMMEQGSDAWFSARIGRATASRIADIVARTKSGYSTSRANYAAQLICERLTGEAERGYVNAAMQHGIDHEDDARTAYEFARGVEVQQVGFVDHPTIPLAGASPDGLVGADGLLEIKCPQVATHQDALIRGVIADKYIVQMQWQMACTKRAWCDFASYHPAMPVEMRLWVKRIERDEARIAELQTEVAKFLDEVADAVADLNARYRPATIRNAPCILAAG